LTPQEQYHADYMQRQVNERFGNALGYEVSITTLTTIVKKISEQKFFEIPPADFCRSALAKALGRRTCYLPFV
jgi:hypothetical protein